MCLFCLLNPIMASDFCNVWYCIVCSPFYLSCGFCLSCMHHSPERLENKDQGPFPCSKIEQDLVITQSTLHTLQGQTDSFARVASLPKSHIWTDAVIRKRCQIRGGCLQSWELCLGPIQYHWKVNVTASSSTLYNYLAYWSYLRSHITCAAKICLK